MELQAVAARGQDQRHLLQLLQADGHFMLDLRRHWLLA